MNAWDDLPEAARDLMANFDELAIAEMCVAAQAELAKLKAPVVGYRTADGRCYHSDDITIIRSTG